MYKWDLICMKIVKIEIFWIAIVYSIFIQLFNSTISYSTIQYSLKYYFPINQYFINIDKKLFISNNIVLTFSRTSRWTDR